MDRFPRLLLLPARFCGSHVSGDLHLREGASVCGVAGFVVSPHGGMSRTATAVEELCKEVH